MSRILLQPRPLEASSEVVRMSRIQGSVGRLQACLAHVACACARARLREVRRESDGASGERAAFGIRRSESGLVATLSAGGRASLDASPSAPWSLSAASASFSTKVIWPRGCGSRASKRARPRRVATHVGTCVPRMSARAYPHTHLHVHLHVHMLARVRMLVPAFCPSLETRTTCADIGAMPRCTHPSHPCRHEYARA